LFTDRWQKFTALKVRTDVADLAQWCDEFLVHAVEVEGFAAGGPGLVEAAGPGVAHSGDYAGGPGSCGIWRTWRGRARAGLT